MPSKPNKIKRAYKHEAKPFERSVDNSWFYNDYRWRKFTKGFKRRNPLCIDCKEEGVITATTVCDHKQQFSEDADGWNLNKLKDKDYNPKCNFHHNKRSGRQRHGLE